MRLLDHIVHTGQPAPSRPPWPVALVAALLTAAAVAAGGWVSGGLLTDDATLAKGATAAWFVLAGGLALLVALRWRALALSVLAAYVLATAAIGGFLLWTSTVDRVVAEDVLTAPEQPPASGPATSARRTPAAPVLVGRGDFRSGEHQTTGTAALLRRPDGAAVVTLTDLATSPGPDLRVYLVPGSGADVSHALDLGALRGNRGTQQYDVPAGTVPSRYGSVVVWCRTFSVAFGTASLAQP